MFPTHDTPIPPAIADLAAERVEPLWCNQAGGYTARVDGDRVVKWNPDGSGESLTAEAARLRWLQGRHPAPGVLAYHQVSGGELLVTEDLGGRSAVDPDWVARPGDAIRAIALGLRRLHALPTTDCPFDWSIGTRLHGGTGDTLPQAPPIDRLVVCHGDACAPNTLIADDGGFLATVDVGRLGVADRWADLAVATMSLGWNYQTYDERVFWETYGVEPDPVRIEYYRALWDAT